MARTNGHILSADEVKNKFSSVLNEISRTGGPIIVARGGKAVAVILSTKMFARLRPKPKRASNRRALALAAFGMWANRAEIDDDWLLRSRARWQSDWTP